MFKAHQSFRFSARNSEGNIMPWTPVVFIIILTVCRLEKSILGVKYTCLCMRVNKHTPLGKAFFSTSPAVSSILSLSDSSAFRLFWISSSLFTISGNEGLSFGSIWDISGGNKNIKTHQHLILEERHVLTSILRILHCTCITVGRFHFHAENN